MYCRSDTDDEVEVIETVTHVDFTGVNGLAVRLQKLRFMKPLFLSKFKVSKSNIQLLVEVCIFVETA